MQLFRQEHNQVFTVFSKGFYNNIQYGSRYVYNCIVFSEVELSGSLRAVGEKQDISLLWP